MTKTNSDEKPEIKSRQSKCNNVWTKEKIAQLIQLYKQHDCLWNHYTEAYKNKEKRNKAIENICGVLQISKFDFGKKIHNLRNQFNSEMKKLERRIEESGGNANDLSVSGQRCRWEHFESLCFLKNIIEPRPGYQTTISPPKKMCVKYDYNSEEEHYIARIETTATTNANTMGADEVEEYFEEATADDDEDTIDTYEETNEEAHTMNKRREIANISSPATATSTHELITLPTPSGQTKTYLKRIHSTRSSTQMQQQQHQSTSTPQTKREEHFFSLTSSPITPNATNIKQTPGTNCQTLESGHLISTLPTMRDQWDAFGELVASEFRNLNSESSRKKLKRKIMQAMLEIGDEDDSICVNVTVH